MEEAQINQDDEVLRLKRKIRNMKYKNKKRKERLRGTIETDKKTCVCTKRLKPCDSLSETKHQEIEKKNKNMK